MSQLILKAMAKGNSHTINLYLSVTQDDGTPVEGLTGINLDVKMACGFYADEVFAVPTTYIEQNSSTNPVFDVEPPVSIVSKNVVAQGLPGFYALHIDRELLNWGDFDDREPYAIQISAKHGADAGQTITEVEIHG